MLPIIAAARRWRPMSALAWWWRRLPGEGKRSEPVVGLLFILARPKPSRA